MAPVEPLWLKKARELVGLREIVGSRHEPKVVKFYAEAGFPGVKDDETAWCAAFANAMLKRSGIKGTGSLAARSFLSWGKALKTPKPGAIVVFKRGNSSWQGHVAFFISETATHLKVLGGNQANAVSIANYSKAALLGYRWPETEAKPAVSDDVAGAEAAEEEFEEEEIDPSQTADVDDFVLTKAVIMDVQRQLRDRGFPAVGKIDGEVGPDTLGAITAFRAARGLPNDEDPEINQELIDALAKAKAEGWKKPISEERATATAIDLQAQKIETADAAIKGEKVIKAAGAATVVTYVADKAADTFQSVQGVLGPAQKLIRSVPPELYVVGGLAIIGYLGWQLFRVKRDTEAKYRSGALSS